MFSLEDKQTVTPSGCQNCVSKESSSLKTFLYDVWNPDIIMTNDRIIWDNLLTEIELLFKSNDKWIEKVNFFSFLEFCLDADYILKKGSNISVMGLKLLSSVCENEEYFIKVKSEKVFLIFLRSIDTIMQSVFLQSAAFLLIKRLSSHHAGIMWIVEEKILQNVICTTVLSSNECMQKDAASCISSIWCCKKSSFKVHDWIVAQLYEILSEDNLIKEGRPNKNFRIMSVIEIFILIIEENYKRFASSEKLIRLFEKLCWNPFQYIEEEAHFSIVYKYNFLCILDEYAKTAREMEDGTIPEGEVDETKDKMLMCITYAVAHNGLNITLIEKSIDLFHNFKDNIIDDYMTFLSRYRNVLSVLSSFQFIPLLGLICVLENDITSNCAECFPDVECHRQYIVRKQNIKGRIKLFEMKIKSNILAELGKCYTDSIVSPESVKKAFKWATRLMKALVQHCQIIPGITASLLDCILLNLMIVIPILLDRFDFEDSFFEVLFKLLWMLNEASDGLLLEDNHLIAECILTIMAVIKRRKKSPKLISTGLDLILYLFESNEIRKDVVHDTIFFNAIFREILSVRETEQLPGTSSSAIVRYMTNPDDLKFLQHDDATVRTSALGILKALTMTGGDIEHLMDYMVTFGLLKQLCQMFSDSSTDVVTAALDVFRDIVINDAIWQIFFSKNLNVFCLALVAESTSYEIRLGGVRLIDRIVYNRNYWYLDLELYFMPAIRIAAEDEHDTVRLAALSFMSDHILTLFKHAEKMFVKIQDVSVPSPHLAVLIWITQYGYGGALMKLYYDKCHKIQMLAKSLVTIIIDEMDQSELISMIKLDFRLFELPLENCNKNFKPYCDLEKDEHLFEGVSNKTHIMRSIHSSMIFSVTNSLRFITDLTDTLRPEIAHIQKYKKKVIETIPLSTQMKDIKKSVTVKEFLTFIREHERSMCTHQHNKESHLLTNIDAYISQLKASPGCAYDAADCY